MASNGRKEREAREERERLRRYEARQQVHAYQNRRRKLDNIAAAIAIVVIATAATIAQLTYFGSGPGAPEPSPTPTATPAAEPSPGSNVGDVPDPELSESRTWTGQMQLNDVTLGIELDGQAAPQAVASFVQGVRDGYFDGKSCHRLVDSDTAGLIQCGSADGTGASDPTYSFGPIENAPVDGMYPAGTIAMARVGGDAYSQGRQFFIVYEDTLLPADSAGGYTVFGHVTDGLGELIAQIVSGGIQAGTSETDGPPAIATTIEQVTIE